MTSLRRSILSFFLSGDLSLRAFNVTIARSAADLTRSNASPARPVSTEPARITLEVNIEKLSFIRVFIFTSSQTSPAADQQVRSMSQKTPARTIEQNTAAEPRSLARPESS